MLKIIIQNPHSETVINNVFPDQLPFWETLLEAAQIQGHVQIVYTQTGETYQPAA